jgi:hypothetical protein
MAEVAYATGPTLLGASLFFCSLIRHGLREPFAFEKTHETLSFYFPFNIKTIFCVFGLAHSIKCLCAATRFVHIQNNHMMTSINPTLVEEVSFETSAKISLVRLE